MITKALSIRQPWAAFMAAGFKRIENRTWRSSTRGRVLIHSGKWWDAAEAQEDFDDAAHIMATSGLGPPPFDLSEVRNTRGGVVGAFTIVDCVSQSDDPFFFGPYGFVVTDAVALPVIVPCRGALGFFDVPRKVAEQCDALLEAVAAS